MDCRDKNILYSCGKGSPYGNQLMFEVVPNLFHATISLCGVVFKADFHIVYIQAWKDPEQKWHQFPYLVSETEVQEVVVSWPTEWRAPSKVDVGKSTGARISTAQKRKEVAKKVARTLAEQRKKEAVEKALIEQEHATEEQTEKEQRES